jgi:hypothetical protein
MKSESCGSICASQPRRGLVLLFQHYPTTSHSGNLPRCSKRRVFVSALATAFYVRSWSLIEEVCTYGATRLPIGA